MSVDDLETDTVESVLPIGRPKRRRPLTGWRGWLLTGGILAVTGFAVWVIFFSAWLGLRTVHVEGASGTLITRVVTAAHVAPGTPLARVDLAAVMARVDSIPVVASATVQRDWPHTITIRVTERRPVAVVRHNGSWWEMDKTGVLFATVKTLDGSEPIVELDGSPGPQTLPQVASVLGSLPQALLTNTRRVTASSMDSITLHLHNGSEVRWGSAADSAEKAAVLHALLAHKAQMYDVSIPSQPAMKG